MGSTPSKQKIKTVYLTVDGREASVSFSPNCSSEDLREVLLSAAGLGRSSSISLSDTSGCLQAISPTLPANTPDTRYTVKQVSGVTAADKDMFHNIISKVGEEFSKALKISEFSDRLQQVEAHLHAIPTDSVKGSEAVGRVKGRPNGRLPAQPPIKRGVPPYPKYVVTTETEEYLKKPTFDSWHWEASEMVSLMEHMYHSLGLVTATHMNPETLKKWLYEVHDNYRDNPFHNFRHCFSVTQMLYGMVHLCNLQNQLSKLDLVALITAAVCHDLDHPGFSNSYQVNARTPLAVRYNDISPLENHHCAVAFQILGKPENNIFSYVSPEDFKTIRSDIIELILATDMSRHAELLSQWREVLATGMDYRNNHHIKLLKIMLLKCCDISNEVRPVAAAEAWLDCLLEEYFNQSDREKVEGLPVTPFMDRDRVTRSSSQVGFIRFILLPLFESMNILFPQLEEPMVCSLRKSLEHYERMKEQETRQKRERGGKEEEGVRKGRKEGGKGGKEGGEEGGEEEGGKEGDEEGKEAGGKEGRGVVMDGSENAKEEEEKAEESHPT